MDISQPQPGEGRQLVRSYGDGRFRIGAAGTVHAHPVLVLPERTVPWAVSGLADLEHADGLDSLAPVFEHQPAVEILLIGCGRGWRPLVPVLRQALKAHGLAVDAMDTGAACRTFNVLLLEDRRVAAALIPV